MFKNLIFKNFVYFDLKFKIASSLDASRNDNCLLKIRVFYKFRVF